jgi:fatty-acid desaturase
MNFFSSSEQTLNKIQIFTILCTLLGLFYFQFTMTNIVLMIVSFYIYSILGLSMTMHRYYTHKSFELNKVMHWLFTFIAILTGRGSPLGWVYVHRQHHAYSDTEAWTNLDKHILFAHHNKLVTNLRTDRPKFSVFYLGSSCTVSTV